MKIFTFFLILFMLLASGIVFSQAGLLDSSFGNNGKVIRPPGYANAVAIAPDGKIVVAGHSASGFTLVRYGRGGTIDKSFGVNGVAVADFGDSVNAIANALTIKPSGKIVAVGTDGKNFAIAKFNIDGTLDTSFGRNGKVTTNFFGKRDNAVYITTYSDNKILVIGTAFVPNGEQTRMVVARYKPNGVLDSSFGGDGKVTSSFNQALFDEGSSLILQPDGKIVAIGTSFHLNPDITEFDFALVRYFKNGSIDKSFGTNGYTFTDFNNLFDVAVGAAQQSDGKIIVAGYVLPVTVDFRMMELARYTSNGKLDTTFGMHGKVLTTFNGSYDAAYGLTIQNDDKIVVAGAGGGIEVGRFTKDGKADSSFGSDGRVNIDSVSDAYVRSVALQTNGKIIAAGSVDGKFLICRLLNDQVKTMSVEAQTISETKDKPSNIILYPNPADNVVLLKNIPEGSLITMFNEQGIAVMQSVAVKKTHQFNIQKLTPGVYFVQVKLNGKMLNELKFIKQH